MISGMTTSFTASLQILDKAIAAVEATLAARVRALSKSPPKIHDHGPDAPEDHEDNTFGLPDGAPIRKKLKAFFAIQAKHVLGEVRSIGAAIPETFPALSDYDDPMASAMTPILSAYWDRAGSEVREKLGLDPDEWRVVDKNTHKKIREAAFNFSASTNKTTSLKLDAALEALRAELIAGVVTEGESIAKLTKRVKSVFTEASTSRARRIAATEASRAVHSAALESAHQSGVVQGKRWLLSSNACPLCHQLAASSASVPLGNAFGKVGSNPAYSEIQCPPGHPGCRCSLTLVLSPEYDGSKTDATVLDLNEGEVPAFEPKPAAEPKQPEIPAAIEPARIPPGPIGERVKAYREGPGKAKIDALAGIDPTLDEARLKGLDKARDDARQILDKLRRRKKKATAEEIAEAEKAWREAGDLAHEYTFEKHRVAGQALEVLSQGPDARAHLTTRTLDGKPLPANAATAERWLGRVLATNPAHPGGIEASYAIDPEVRANYSKDRREIRLKPDQNADVIIHEFGHGIEHQWPDVDRRSREFLDHRMAGSDERVERLDKLFPGRGFRDHEVGRGDHFGRAFDQDPVDAFYCGKEYRRIADDPRSRYATEILSMGIQKLHEDPIGFARKDPEYCAFVLGILDGSLR